MKKSTKIFLALVGLAALAGIAFLIFWPSLPEKSAEAPAPPLAQEKEDLVRAGSILTLKSDYENSESEAMIIRVEETAPGGTEYIPGSLTLNGSSLTDENDGDAGYYDSAARKAIWQVGEIFSGTKGSVSYKVRVTGEAQQMQSVTEIILDPGTEDEESLIAEPFAFSIGGTFPGKRSVRLMRL